MTRNVKVIEIYKPESDVRLYVLALIALARQMQDDEEVKDASDMALQGNEENGRD